MARRLFLLVLLPALSPAFRLDKSDGPLATDALSLNGRQSVETEADRGPHAGDAGQGQEGIDSGFLEVMRRNLAWKSVPRPDTSSGAEAAHGQVNAASDFPPWATNLYNFVLRWSPLAFVMCACTFLCFLATGQKPEQLDYFGVLANLFIFEVVVLLLAGAVHTFVAGREAPHFLAKLSGVSVFGCGTVVNIWWLAWQTVRKRSSAKRPPPAAEGVRQNSSAASFRAGPSSGRDAGSSAKLTDTANSKGGQEGHSWSSDAFLAGPGDEANTGQTWNSDAFGATSFGSSGGAPFTRPPKGGASGRASHGY